MKILLSFLLAVLAFNLNAQKPAARIVSLAPSLTESIYYMGAAGQLVGRTSYRFIADADDKEVVASAVSVNIEKVLTLTAEATTSLSSASAMKQYEVRPTSCPA